MIKLTNNNVIIFDKLKTKSAKFQLMFLKIYTQYFFIDNLSLIELKDLSTTISYNKYQLLEDITIKSLNNFDVTFLLKRKKFYNINLYLKKGVFVPQYDSEGLIDLVFDNLKNNSNKYGLEVGVGGGAIICSLLKNSNFIIKGIDISDDAIKLTRKNLDLNYINCNRYQLEKISIFDLGNEKFDFIIANPPYIALDDKNVSDWVKKNQPHFAIYESEIDKFYNYLIINASKFLWKNGKIFFEIDNNVREKLIKNFTNLTFYKDLNNKWRYCIYKYEG